MVILEISEIAIENLEFLLWGIALTLLIFCTFLFYIRGAKNKIYEGYQILFGFSAIFFAFYFWILFQIIIDLNYSNVKDFSIPISSKTFFLEFFDRISILFFTSFFSLFFYYFEKLIKKTHFLITLGAISLLIISFLLPYKYAYLIQYNFIFQYILMATISILFYITKISQLEFKSISSFILLGGSFYAIALFTYSPQIRLSNCIPNIISPIFFILGSIIASLPTLLNAKFFSKPLECWLLLGSMTIIMQIIVFFMELIIGLNAINYMVMTISDLILFIYFHIIIIKTIRKRSSINPLKNNGIYSTVLEKSSFSYILKTIQKDRLDEIYKLLSTSTDDLIFLFDENFKILYINENVSKKILGYRREDLLNKNFKEILNRNDKIKLENIIKDQKKRITIELR
ncbi:MAG: PAS domain-containing protein, partial [Promethearchaeia archaeon]